MSDLATAAEKAANKELLSLESILSIEKLEGYAEKAIDASIAWLPNLFLALCILIFGFWLSNRAVRLINKALIAKKVERTLRDFLEGLLGTLFKAAVVIAAITLVGVKTTSLVALLGAAGLAIGLALQGSLSNFAGGMLILFFKPFKAGDTIITSGKRGNVEKIMLFNTRMKMPSNEVIFVPNGGLANGIIENITAEKTRRLDIPLGIGYEADIDLTRQVLLDLVKTNENILETPAPEVLVLGHGDSAVNIELRVWVETINYFATSCFLWEMTKKEFDKNGISIPYPQRDVHIHNKN